MLLSALQERIRWVKSRMVVHKNTVMKCVLNVSDTAKDFFKERSLKEGFEGRNRLDVPDFSGQRVPEDRKYGNEVDSKWTILEK